MIMQILCRLACDILRTEGYRAVPASNAAEALRAFEEQDFDLLVTAFQMPGMTGIDLARAVRNRNPDFPVIVMTAFEPGECEHVNALGLPEGVSLPQSVGEYLLLPRWSQNGTSTQGVIMVIASELKEGTEIRIDGRIYKVLEVESKAGAAKLGGVVKTKLCPRR